MKLNKTDTIAHRMQEALRLRRMKQADLVRETGIGKSSISTYLTGEYEPKQQNIYKIAQALDVSEAWLMGLNVPMERESAEQSGIKVQDVQGNVVVLDDETRDAIEALRTRPEMKVLFSVSKKASKQDIIMAAKIIEDLRNRGDGD